MLIKLKPRGAIMAIWDDSSSNLSTFLGAVVCIALVMPVTFVAFFVLRTAAFFVLWIAGLEIYDPQASQLPLPTVLIVYEWPPAFILGTVSGWTALSLAALIVRRANRTYVAYAAVAVYELLMAYIASRLWIQKGSLRQPAEAIIQALGLAFGLFIAARRRRNR